MLHPRYPAELARILARLCADTASDSVLFINEEGTLCGGQGNYADPAIRALTSRIHGNIFRHSEPQPPEGGTGMMFNVTPEYGVFLAEAAQNHVLVLAFSQGTHIGLVKRCVRSAVSEINDLLQGR